jgi:hypothetical protein
VTFAGVVDDVLRQAHAALGHDEAAARWAARAAAGYQRLGATWWLARLELPVAGVAHLAPGTDGVWTIGAAGRQVQMREVKGLRYLRLLLQRPGTPIPALELSAAVAGHAVFEEPGLEVLDRQAVNAYRRRLEALDEQLDEADGRADSARRAAVVAEREMLSTSWARRRVWPGGPAAPAHRPNVPGWPCRSPWQRRSGGSARSILRSGACCTTPSAPGTCASTNPTRPVRCAGSRSGQKATYSPSRFTRLVPRLVKVNVRSARTVPE